MEYNELYEKLFEEFGEFSINPQLEIILDILKDNSIEYEFFSCFFEKEKLKTKDINEVIIKSLQNMTVYEVQETIKEQYPEKASSRLISENVNYINKSFQKLIDENNRTNKFLLLEEEIELFKGIAKNAIIFNKESIFENLENQNKKSSKNKP